MIKEEVIALLNSNKGFNSGVRALVKFVTQPEISEKIINYIYEKAKLTKNFNNVHMFMYYQEVVKPVVLGTALCKNEYAANVVIRSSWDISRMQAKVIAGISQRANKKSPVISTIKVEEPAIDPPVLVEKATKEESKKKPEKPKAQRNRRETEEERAIRLKKQAERMREAKAKKAKKTKGLDQTIKEHKPKLEESKPQVSQQKKEDGLSEEQRRQIEMLKNLSI